MINSTTRAFFVSVALIALCACSQESTNTASPSSTPASAPTAVESKPSGPAYVVPDELTDCTQGKIVTLKWDFRATNPEISNVEILTGAPGHETLFAAGGPNGEAPTGPWASPGTAFIIKNKTDGKELSRVVVSGPACTG